MIETDIRKLAQYGVKTGLVPEEDRIYTINRLLELFELDELEEISGEQAAEIAETETEELEQILAEFVGKEIKIMVQSTQQGRNPRELYPDLTKLVSQTIHMEVEELEEEPEAFDL